MDGQDEQPQPYDEADPQEVDRPLIQRVERHLLGRVVAGFFVLIPLVATIFILQFFFINIDRIFRGEGGIFTPFIKDTPLNFAGVGVIFVVIVLYLIGLLVSSRAWRRRVVYWQGAVLSRVPVVKSIYGVARQVTDSLSSPLGHEFSRVVFLEWPRPGMKALGFVTGHTHAIGDDRSPIVVVYVPTVPNPTSGNLAFVSERDVIETDLSVEDAMKVVFSGGIVLPDAMQGQGRSRLPRAVRAQEPLDTRD